MKKDIQEQDEPQLFSFSVSTDNGQFFRRTCPSCGRDYKTETNPEDIQWLVAPQIKRMGVDIGEPPSKSSEESKQDKPLYCPYCEHQAKASDTLTAETMAYLRRLIHRDVVMPMLSKQLSQFADIGKRSSGFVTMKFSYDPATLPPRPIHGPELPDMRIIDFLCCGKKIKVSDGWANVLLCTYCGTPVVLM